LSSNSTPLMGTRGTRMDLDGRVAMQDYIVSIASFFASLSADGARKADSVLF
jgi:hypothetical protein